MALISKDLVNFLTVGEADSGQRLDNYLFKTLKGVPKSHVQRIIRAGEVRLNKKRCKGTDRVAEGDVVRVPPVRVAAAPSGSPKAHPAPAKDFAVIYEDDALLVINKPAGVAVHAVAASALA